MNINLTAFFAKFLIACLLFYSNNSAAKESFLIKKDAQILEKKGLIHERHSPCSTFKIPLSLMAYNENILIDENNPKIPYNDTYQESREICKQTCNPLKWMRHSCIWYSQIITQNLGMKKFQNYVTQFN